MGGGGEEKRGRENKLGGGGGMGALNTEYEQKHRCGTGFHFVTLRHIVFSFHHFTSHGSFISSLYVTLYFHVITLRQPH